MLGTIIAARYQLIEKLGIGPFYEVFRGKHVHNLTAVAVKIEQRVVGDSKLLKQAKILKDLQGEEDYNDYGLSNIFEAGSDERINYVITDLLGQSLDRYMADNGGVLNLQMACELGVQMVQRIEFIHSRGYVHRDLRPEHFLLGRPKKPNRLYLTGLTTARKYLYSDGRHATYKDNKPSFTGTARYMSINTQLGIEQSRRDDIEAIIHILVFCIKGRLPWQGLKASCRREKYQKILEVKVSTPLEVVCADLPQIITELLSYARTLEYEDKPDYEYIKKSLRNLVDVIKVRPPLEINEDDIKPGPTIFME